jgi:hypothetical protein
LIKLDLVQKVSSRAQKIEIKYGCEGFEIWNNFPYRNFHILEKNFELKLEKPVGFEFDRNLIEIHLGTSKLDET